MTGRSSGRLFNPWYPDTFWDDLQVSNSFKQGGGNDPTLIQHPANGGFFYAFGSGDELGFDGQSKHRGKETADLHLHLHWNTRDRGVTESGNTVNWRVDLSVTPVGGVTPVVTTFVLTDTCDGVDHKHQIVEATVVVPAMTLSSAISGRVYRLAGDTWVGVGANGPMLYFLDFHFEIDQPGSQEEYKKIRGT